jgi:hypothetical protein
MQGGPRTSTGPRDPIFHYFPIPPVWLSCKCRRSSGLDNQIERCQGSGVGSIPIGRSILFKHLRHFIFHFFQLLARERSAAPMGLSPAQTRLAFAAMSHMLPNDAGFIEQTKAILDACVSINRFGIAAFESIVRSWRITPGSPVLVRKIPLSNERVKVDLG